MRERPSNKLAILIALYFVQGLPFGFQAVALPVYLRSRGVSVTAIGFLGALALPWLFKALWAPLVDGYGSERLGQRKSWILPLQLAQALVCFGASFVPIPDGLALLLPLVFVMNLIAATQDIAVDGWAVDALRQSELGLGNAVQVIGYKLGMLTGGGLLVWASQFIGWSGLFVSMGVLNLLVFGLALVAREPTRSHQDRENIRGVLARLRQALRLPNTGYLLLFVGTYKLGESMSDVLYKPFLVDAGIRPEQIGLWVGTWGMLASILGTLAGGVLAARLPLLAAVGWTAVLRLVPLAARSWLALSGVSDARVITVTLGEEFFGGALTTAMFAFMMSRVDRRVSASHYTLLASVEVAGKLPGGPLGGLLVGRGHWSYYHAFTLALGLSAAFLLLLRPLVKKGAVSAAEPG